MGKKKIREIKATAVKKTTVSNEPELNLDAIKQCPECGSNNIHLSKMRAEIVCSDCGGIFSRLTPGREKRFRRASNIV